MTIRRIIKARDWDRIAKWIDLLRLYSRERGFYEGSGTAANPTTEAKRRFHQSRTNKAYERLWDAIRAIEGRTRND